MKFIIFRNEIIDQFSLHASTSITNNFFSLLLKIINRSTSSNKSTSFIIKDFSFFARKKCFNISQISRNNFSQSLTIFTCPIYSSLIVITKVHLRLSFRSNIQKLSNCSKESITLCIFMHTASNLHHTISKNRNSSIKCFTSRTILNLRRKRHSKSSSNRRC